MADNQLPQEELEEQESLRDYLDPIVSLGKRGWADIVEMYEGTKALAPLGKMLWELSAQGETPEEREAQEARRVQMIKGLYKEAPIEMAKDVAKLAQPEEWVQHPVHTIMRAMLAKELITGLPRVGPKISAGISRGAGGVIKGLEKAKMVHKLPVKRVAWGEMGGYTPDDVVKHFRDMTSKDILRRTGARTTTEAFEKAKEARLSAEMVTRGTELTLDQVNDLRKLTKALKSLPEKKHAGLLQHWSKKFKMSIADLRKIMRTVAESETGAVTIKGKTFRAPWEMTKAEFMSEAKGLPANMYDDIIYSAYERGMDIPDEVLAPFKTKFSPRPSRPGPTPKGKQPLWARGMERIGESSGRYDLTGRHATQVPKGYVNMEEAMFDNWVRFAGPGTFEINELNPSTIRTMQNLIDIYTPKHGVVVDITKGGRFGAHQGFTVPMFELERSKTLMNAIRRSFPKLLEKPKVVEGMRPGVVHGQKVNIETVPSGVSGVKPKSRGPRKTRTTQETIDLIVGEEGATGPKRTVLRKKTIVPEEEIEEYLRHKGYLKK